MASLENSILDYIATAGSENRVIDLDSVFSGAGLSYSVESSNEGIATATLQGNQLVVDYTDALGYTDLKITATDASGNSVTEDVRVRVAGENAYTIAVLPDTQDYTNAAGVETFKKMTSWLVENKESLGIQFVTHVGDITTENSNTHWGYAKEALSILDGKIPYGLTLGNHDGVSGSYSSSNINNHFSVDQLKEANGDNFGGTYDQEAEMSNNTYSTFTAPDGTKWLVLNLEFGAREDVVRWAGDVIEENLDHRVILTTHSYMNWAGRHDATGSPLYEEGAGYDYGLGNSPEGATDGETMYRELVQKYPNVSFTFSGHIFGDGAETLVSYDQFGNPVHQMMVNYQNGVAGEITGNDGEGSGGAGGNGAIRLVTIDPDNGNVYTSTYFAGLDSYSDPARGDGELDRDDLTGPYRGHEETFTGLDLGAPKIVAVAEAGNDQSLSIEGQGRADVTLDAGRTLNPGNDAGLSYVWTDAGGHVVGEGANPQLQLGAGQHQFTLTVTDSNGKVSTDDVRVTVSNDRTLLADNFNDGDADGWGTYAPPVQTSNGTISDYGIAQLGGSDATVGFVPKLSTSQGMQVDFQGTAPGTVLQSYTLAFDILVPSSGSSGFTSLFQTDPSNTSDADFFIRSSSDGTGALGISGNYAGDFQYDVWQRVVVKLEANGANAVMSKYIDGVKVGTQTVDTSRFQIDLDKGLLLFSDEDGETSPLYAAHVMLTDKLYTDAEIQQMGTASVGGFVGEKPSGNSFMFDLGAQDMGDVWGSSTITAGETNSGTGSFIVKGTVHSRADGIEVIDAAEGRVWEQSDGAGKVLVWKDAAAQDWTDYEFETTIKVTDNDGVGVVFYYEDADNHYKVVLNAETNSRSLVKVQDGAETVLASEFGGTPWSRDFQLKVAIEGGDIKVFLDGHDLFGTVIDDAPLAGGTVGFLSDGQRSSQFDNVTVNRIDLTAHAGDNARPVDSDGDGQVTVRLDASGSYGATDGATYVWTDAAGKVVATGQTAEVVLEVAQHELTLTITETDGTTATDHLMIDAVTKDRVLMSDSFSGSKAHGWRIVDEGEFGGVGPNGTSSNWKLQDGAFVQLSDLKSRELTWTGSATNADPWQQGWSPLGDGVNVLRKGTYALYDNEKALNWQDYAVEASIQSPDNGALGLMFYYQDAENYYKLELDANGDYDRNPRNGAGSLFQLIQVKDGVEKFLTQIPAKYTPGQKFDLRVEVVDGKIQAFVDGMALFAYAIEDHAQTKGTVGLFSWDSAGVAFDDVRVISLGEGRAEPVQPITGTAGDDRLTGGVENDTISGLGGDDLIMGKAGDDLLDGGAGDDQLRGDIGNDTLTGGAGDDLLLGGAGNDTADYADTRTGVHVNLPAGQATGRESGNDQLTSIENVIGGAGADTLSGNVAANILEGQGGHDLIHGGAGNDTLRGGTGNDTLNGGQGHDLIDAGAGNDVIDGGLGRDTLLVNGATGSIKVDFATGTLVAGAAGTDRFTNIETVLFDGGDNMVTGGDGNDVIDGGAGRDRITGGAGNDSLLGGDGHDMLDGGSGNDRLFGGAGGDDLRGGSGNDLIDGGAGQDTLSGGSGNDRVIGGEGDDLLSGGSGVDTFVFAAGFGHDAISDFAVKGHAADRLEFSGDIFETYQQVIEAAAQVGRDIVITAEDSSLTLKNVQLADLAEDLFTFS